MRINHHRYFICKKHSQALIGNPVYANTIWLRMIDVARNKAAQGHWNEAVKMYGNAFDTMDILLDDEPEQKNIDEYIQTGVELIYAIRHSSYTNNLPFLVSIIQHRVGVLLKPANVDLLIKPARDMAYKPLADTQDLLTIIERHQTAYARTIH